MVSLVERRECVCPICRVEFTAEAIIVFSRAEREDLWCRAQKGALNIVRCPRGHASKVEASFAFLDDATGQLYLCLYDPTPMDNARRLTPIVSHLASKGGLVIDEIRFQHVFEDELPELLTYLEQTPVCRMEDKRRSTEVKRPRPRVEPNHSEFFDLMANKYDHFPAEGIEVCERLLQDWKIPFEDMDEFVKSNWASVQGFLGNYLSDTAQTPEEFQRAQQAFLNCLKVFTKESSPHDWSGTWINLGLLYVRNPFMAERDKASLARGAFEKAVEVRTRRHEPSWFARLQLYIVRCGLMEGTPAGRTVSRAVTRSILEDPPVEIESGVYNEFLWMWHELEKR